MHPIVIKATQAAHQAHQHCEHNEENGQKAQEGKLPMTDDAWVLPIPFGEVVIYEIITLGYFLAHLQGRIPLEGLGDAGTEEIGPRGVTIVLIVAVNEFTAVKFVV